MSILIEKTNVTAEHQRMAEDAGRWDQVLEILDQPMPNTNRRRSARASVGRLAAGSGCRKSLAADASLLSCLQS
jgi:hypothetical protein